MEEADDHVTVSRHSVLSSASSILSSILAFYVIVVVWNVAARFRARAPEI